MNLPLTLDTKFLTEVTNIPWEMVTTVLFSALPKKKAKSSSVGFFPLLPTVN